MADVMLGAVIVLILAAAASAAGTVAGAEQANHEAARNAALWAARTGDADRARTMGSRLAPDATVAVTITPEQAIAVVATPVALAHPLLGRVPLTTSASISIPIAPYRSNRG